jgi:hypothetical protein
VVKASTWEQPFHSRISAARALELAVLRTTLLLQVRVEDVGVCLFVLPLVRLDTPSHAAASHT